MTVGFRVLNRKRTIDPELAKRFHGLPVANVSDSMHRMSAAGVAIRPMHAGGAMSGPALTVRTRPGDNLMVHMALELSVPGDVIVVDAAGDLTNAIFGEMMLGTAVRKNLGGIVIFGAIRDSAAIRAASLPVFAAGVTHRGPYKNGPGEVNVVISIGGMTIEPGDLIIGDEDGVLAVPLNDAASLYEAARSKQDAETEFARRTAAGTTHSFSVRETLVALGAEFEDRDPDVRR